MAQLKVLFADDDIPDKSIKCKDIKTNRSRLLCEAVEKLVKADYEVITARTNKEAEDLIKKFHFDIAIVDFNWMHDESLSFDKRAAYGWDICNAIEKANEKSIPKKTLQIIYSAEFRTNPEISITAAQKGRLPIYRTDNEVDPFALVAAVRFIEQNLNLTNSSDKEQFSYKNLVNFYNLLIGNFEKMQKQQWLWFILTAVFVAISISLLIIGAIGTIFWNLQVDTLTSVSSIITSFISFSFFFQLRSAQNNVKESIDAIINFPAPHIDKIQNNK